MRTIFTKQNDTYAITDFDNVFAAEIIIITFNNVLSNHKIFDVENALIITTSRNVRVNTINASFVRTNIKSLQILVLNANMNNRDSLKHEI